jgi:hypothetical protein
MGHEWMHDGDNKNSATEEANCVMFQNAIALGLGINYGFDFLLTDGGIFMDFIAESLTLNLSPAEKQKFMEEYVSGAHDLTGQNWRVKDGKLVFDGNFNIYNIIYGEEYDGNNPDAGKVMDYRAIGEFIQKCLSKDSNMIDENGMVTLPDNCLEIVDTGQITNISNKEVKVKFSDLINAYVINTVTIMLGVSSKSKTIGYLLDDGFLSYNEALKARETFNPSSLVDHWNLRYILNKNWEYEIHEEYLKDYFAKIKQKDDTNEGNPATGDFMGESWTLLKNSESMYHDELNKDGSGCWKWVSESGREFVMKMIVDKDGNVIGSEFQNNPNFMGTYNIGIKSDSMYGLIHFMADMVPYYTYGNAPDDKTIFHNRLFGYVIENYLKKNEEELIKIFGKAGYDYIVQFLQLFRYIQQYLREGVTDFSYLCGQ